MPTMCWAGDAKKNLRRWNKYADALEFDHPGLHRLYNATDEPANLLLTTTESRLARTAPTEKFGATWNIVDAVFAKKGIEGGGDYEKMNFVGHYLFTSSPSPVKEGFYMAKFDEISSSESTGSKPRELYVTNVLLTVDEVLLNRMEAYAMRKDYNRAIDDLVEYMQGKFGFMPAVERSVYTTTDRANYNVISPTYGLTLKQLALVKTILDFRRKEFFQEGLRWFDIRRFHLSVRRSSKSLLLLPARKGRSAQTPTNPHAGHRARSSSESSRAQRSSTLIAHVHSLLTRIDRRMYPLACRRCPQRLQ